MARDPVAASAVLFGSFLLSSLYLQRVLGTGPLETGLAFLPLAAAIGALGARPEFEERQQGLAGMREVYGLDNVTFRAIPIGQQYRALDRKQIDAADVFSTDGQLASGSYKVLEDTQRLFGFQHVALVIDQEKLSKLGGRSFMRIIDDLNGRLTTSVMIQMNCDVGVDGQAPAVVAERFLRTAGLLGRKD